MNTVINNQSLISLKLGEVIIKDKPVTINIDSYTIRLKMYNIYNMSINTKPVCVNKQTNV